MKFRELNTYDLLRTARGDTVFQKHPEDTAAILRCDTCGRHKNAVHPESGIMVHFCPEEIVILVKEFQPEDEIFPPKNRDRKLRDYGTNSNYPVVSFGSPSDSPAVMVQKRKNKEPGLFTPLEEVIIAIEAFRLRASAMGFQNITPDKAIRICQEILAEAAGYSKDRRSWETLAEIARIENLGN